MSYHPSGTSFESYKDDQKWWPTPFIKGKMILMAAVLALFPFLVHPQWLSVAYTISYYILAALGVQLLIGYSGQITLGHAAFVAVGGYCSAMMVLLVPWPQFIVDAGLAYPIGIVCAAVVAGLWSMLFGLPAVRGKGFYLIMTTMAAQWITVPLLITPYLSPKVGADQSLSLPAGAIKIGPWVLDSDMKIYYFSMILVALCLVVMGNLLRSKIGRAWIAIRENEIAAQTMGVNVAASKFLALFVAGFFGGVAGAFNISALRSVSPEQYEWTFSLLLVGIILIGGVGSIHGLVFGSVFVVLVFKLLELSVTGLSGLLMIGHPELTWITAKTIFVKESVLGLAIIFFLLYEPKGLSYRYWQLKNYFNLWWFSYTAKDS